MQLKLYLLVSHFAQRTLYDYRGIDGTGTKSSPATGSNQVSYTVRKLADGNCWMTDNLKLTLSTSHSYEMATFSGGTTTWTPNQDTSSSNPYNIAISQNTKANDSTTGEWYYPWYAATAGQGTNTDTPTINRSICPKSWKLPSSSNFQSLIAYYSTREQINSVPVSFGVSGGYVNGSINGRNKYAIIWSVSPQESPNTTDALRLFYDITSNTPAINGGWRYEGYPLRCIAIP